MTLVHVDRDGPVAILTLNDPERRNLLSLPLCKTLSAAIADANADQNIKAIIITATDPAFCAGADLDDLQAAAGGETEALHAVYQSFMDVANSALPTIAAVNGIAVGAGMNLALACDMRIASTDAAFDTRFLKIGLHPGGGHSWMLLRAVGWAQATQLLLFARSVKAEEAEKIGLVQSISAPGALLADAIALARRTDALPRALIIAAKASMRQAAASDHAGSFAHETGEQMLSLGRPPFLELVKRMQTSMARR